MKNDCKVRGKRALAGRLKTVGLATMALMCMSAFSVSAQTKHVRVMWDDNPDKNVVVGFSAAQSGAVLKYGTTTDETKWTTASVTRARTLVDGNETLTSQFVQLSNLQPNTAYYMRACDASGCGTKYWFKTMGSAPQDMTFIAGGDSRTNRTVLQTANKMVAKIRPSFVYFGGDLTNNSTPGELTQWLEDWELTYPADTISGSTWKYIPGLVVAVGNHEDRHMDFVCSVFGAEKNKDNLCSNLDTYGAFNINGNQLRLYNLNSQLRSSAADHLKQTEWMVADLKGAGSLAQWRMAGYHVPALPRTNSKSSSTPAMVAWGTHFFDHKVNVVFESDSHLMKVTKPVKPHPTSVDYQSVIGGTVYLGEGAWGAPLRDADRPASWLKDLHAAYNFHVLQFVDEKLQVRTVLFNSPSTVEGVTREARNASATVLPTGLPIKLIGGQDAYVLKRDIDGRTAEVLSTTPTPTTTTLTSNVTVSGFNLVEKEEKFFAIDVPTGTTSLTVKLSGGSTGDADIYGMANTRPSEANFAIKSTTSTNQETFTVQSPATGTYYIMVQGWSATPGLSLTATINGTTTTPTPSEIMLTSGVPVSSINLAAKENKYFVINVPAGKASLTVTSSGGSGDADLYGRAETKPTYTSFEKGSWGSTNNESFTVLNPKAGNYYILLQGWDPTTGISLVATIK